MKYSKMKKTMAVIGIAALLACPNGALTAMAETGDSQTEGTETGTQDGSETKDETKGKTTEDENDESEDEKDKNKDEGSKDATSDGEDSDGNTESTSNPKPYSTIDNAKSSNETKNEYPMAATNLRWDGDTGIALFTNPNDYKCGWYAILYKKSDGKYEEIGKYQDGYLVGAEGYMDIHFFNMLKGDGEYCFKVQLVNTETNIGTFSNDYSASWTYTKPGEEKNCPVPKIEIVEGTTIKCSITIDDYTDMPKMQFGYRLWKGNEIIDEWGGNSSYNELHWEQFDPIGSMSVDPRYDYYIAARTISMEPNKGNTSEFCSRVRLIEATESFDDDSDNSSSSSDEEASEPAPAPVYVPATPEEKARYSVVGKETVKCTTTNSSYSVDVQNSLQGPKCFDSIKAVLGDYTIGRTFNILPKGQYVYHTDTKARITLTIPQALQAAGRTYKMICVTEKGQPIELQDIDTSANTITFETDTYYAFALVYKDGAAN